MATDSHGLFDLNNARRDIKINKAEEMNYVSTLLSSTHTAPQKRSRLVSTEFIASNDPECLRFQQNS